MIIHLFLVKVCSLRNYVKHILFYIHSRKHPKFCFAFYYKVWIIRPTIRSRSLHFLMKKHPDGHLCLAEKTGTCASKKKLIYTKACYEHECYINYKINMKAVIYFHRTLLLVFSLLATGVLNIQSI